MTVSLKYIYVTCVFITSSIICIGADPSQLPAPKRESVEWCDIRVAHAKRYSSPRVLLVGDSITSGYFEPVNERIKDFLSCARLSTSRSICDPVFYKELQLILDQYRFDVIHINNGLHGWDYTETEYKNALVYLISYLKEHAPHATIVWALTTPMRDPNQIQKPAAKNSRVKKRNTIAREIMKKYRIAINDIYTPAVYHPEWYRNDGTHFNKTGRDNLGTYVAEAVKKAYYANLPASPREEQLRSLHDSTLLPPATEK